MTQFVWSNPRNPRPPNTIPHQQSHPPPDTSTHSPEKIPLHLPSHPHSKLRKKPTLTHPRPRPIHLRTGDTPTKANPQPPANPHTTTQQNKHHKQTTTKTQKNKHHKQTTTNTHTKHHKTHPKHGDAKHAPPPPAQTPTGITPHHHTTNPSTLR